MIRALPKKIADKIAAGEVVERPLSIVKELIENSLDAGASSVVCEIRKGGKEYIRVTDNGRGIASDELGLAFMRYATSKIEKEEDLGAIRTLGFRGEALASVAAVCRVELISKPAEQRTGMKIRIEAGVTEEMCETACEDGTTIIVTDLFFNMPARRKFLKPDSAESALIIDYLSKMALAYPDVKFRLISGGTVLYSTLGRGDVRSAILTLYSPQVTKGLVSVNAEDAAAGMSLTGYVSAPSFARKNRRYQIFFVNGRWVKSSVMEAALREAFSDKLFEGEHPAAFLFLRTEPAALDVNIHPHKTEIKFLDEEAVSEFLVKSIRRSLLSPAALPDSSSAAKPFVESSSHPFTESAYPGEASNSSGTSDYSRLWDASGESSEAAGAVAEAPGAGEYGRFIDHNGITLTDLRPDPGELFARLRSDEASSEMRAEVQEEAGIYRADGRFRFSALAVVGEVFATYIIAKDDKKVYFIDQHAAHERVLYEELLRRFNEQEALSQPMLTPLLMQPGLAQKEASAEKLALLRQLGYDIEEFGASDLIVRAVPACMDMGEAERFAADVLEQEDLRPSEMQLKRDRIISSACKAAIKANDRLDASEMESLLRRLDACENPLSCPHGRPTLISMGLSDIERQFRRK